MFDWREVGIEFAGRRSGNVKTTCPQCSARRTNKRDKCLSVNVDEGVFHCHYCGWSGRAKVEGLVNVFQPTKKRYVKPEYQAPAVADTSEKLLTWFKGRGISPEVVKRNRIEARRIWMPDSKADERAIAFPYLRQGVTVNVQYRTADKRFRLEKGAELILYGLDDIRAGEPLVIVEGQMDKLSLEEAGYANCVSVPNGASIGDGEWLASAREQLASAEYFILAGDSDEKGKALQQELSRRLGPEKCWRAEWPEGCKDANDALVKLGREAVIEAIECARPLPINGVVEFSDLMPELERLYREGLQRGEHPGWDCLAELYRPRTGEWTLLTGAPNMGKSIVLDSLMMNLALGSGWRFAIYSPEQAPLARHASQLIEIWAGQPFNPGPTTRMDWEQVKTGSETLGDYFKLLQPDEDELTIDGILTLAKACVLRYGIKGFVIDPWNEVEHHRPDGVSETEYVGQSLSKIRRFARLYDVHVWIVAHPTKLQKQADGSYPVATPYDCSGSANFFNKSDMALSVWRDKSDPRAPVELHVQKVRFRENGQLGVARLWYDRVTNRLSEVEGQYRQPPAREIVY